MQNPQEMAMQPMLSQITKLLNIDKGILSTVGNLCGKLDINATIVSGALVGILGRPQDVAAAYWVNHKIR
jgi:hypothetical protein